MNNISGKINLAALVHEVRTLKSGEQVIIIPIGKNKLFHSERGNVYLDMIGFPLKDPDKDRTHMVKQSRSKEETDKMTEEEKAAIPILGNFKQWGESHGEAAPNNSEPVVDPNDGVDDLPW